MVNETNSPELESWVDSANDPSSDFPIQNLPFGRFRDSMNAEWRIGVAIGDYVLDIRRAGLIDHSDMWRLMQLSVPERHTLRQRLSDTLRKKSTAQQSASRAIVRMKEVEIGLPCEIRDYTDFYVGIHHARAVGRLFRPDQPLLPNYQWMPIGYHGRSSTIQPSGIPFPRPVGQVKAPDPLAPHLTATAKLDFELELGVLISRGNVQGERIHMDDAEDHVFGLTLLNDWSARDIQQWEYQPLGPFLSKNFATTLSCWAVPLEALEPFRKPHARPVGDPALLPYLTSAANSDRGSFDVNLEVVLQTRQMAQSGSAGDVISSSNFADAAYWTVAQLITHHTVNGCKLQTADLFGSGTLSGATEQQAGSLLELSSNGNKPLRLSTGEFRRFLEDGDTIVLRAWCERPGFRRIGFGECRATVLPASC